MLLLLILFLSSALAAPALPSGLDNPLPLSPGLVDSDPAQGTRISVVESDSGNPIFEKTTGVDYRALFAYDAQGRLLEI